MSYQVIARKYRPGTFAAVRGQEHVTRTLANAISRKRVAHVYLFCGLRGVGKTSIARIFAKALNCLTPDGAEPCLACENCKDIGQGRSLAVLEVDGASHNSVDNVRELTESVRSSPPPGYQYKLYIIDEVHMLSTAAFNALLKTLEEPPPHTVFILATTESHKIPDTVLSRCQRFDFRGLTLAEIESSLQKILEDEKIVFDKEALRLIARLAEGSLRDAQSLLERVLAYSPGDISAQAVEEALGAVTVEDIHFLSASIFQGEPGAALARVAEIFQKGIDPGILLRHFVAHWRDILLVYFSSPAEISELGLAEGRLADLQNLLAHRSGEDIQDLVQLARTGAERALQSEFPQYAFESLVVRLSTRRPVKELSETLQKVRESLSKNNGASAGQGLREALPAQTKNATPATPRQKENAQPLSSTSSEAPENEKKSEDFDSGAFVKFLSGKVSPIFLEQLKRLKISCFSNQQFSLQGSELSVRYVDNDSHRGVLKEKLLEFTGRGPWSISIESTETRAGAANGSILKQEQEERRNALQEKKSSLESHPAVQSLRKAFPGSTIERLRVKVAGRGEEPTS